MGQPSSDVRTEAAAIRVAAKRSGRSSSDQSRGLTTLSYSPGKQCGTIDRSAAQTVCALRRVVRLWRAGLGAVLLIEQVLDAVALLMLIMMPAVLVFLVILKQRRTDRIMRRSTIFLNFLHRFCDGRRDHNGFLCVRYHRSFVGACRAASLRRENLARAKRSGKLLIVRRDMFTGEAEWRRFDELTRHE